MPSHTAIKRPRPPTARRNHHSAGTAALRRTPRIPTAHRAPTSAGESAVPIPSHFHRKTRNATPTTPRQTPGNPITQRIAPPTSAGELPQPSAPRLRQAPENSIGQARPFLQTKNPSSALAERILHRLSVSVGQLSIKSPHGNSRVVLHLRTAALGIPPFMRMSSQVALSPRARKLTGRSPSARMVLSVPHFYIYKSSQGSPPHARGSAFLLPRVGSSPSPQRMGSFCC